MPLLSREEILWARGPLRTTGDSGAALFHQKVAGDGSAAAVHE